MKNMIITLAIMLLLTNLIMFQKDTNTLVWTMNNMKLMADEMARSAALEVDEEQYALGTIKFNEQAGKKAAASAFSSGIKSIEDRAALRLFDRENITYTLSFNDEKRQVTVKLNLGTAKYALPYLRTSQKMKCQSVYEYNLPT